MMWVRSCVHALRGADVGVSRSQFNLTRIDAGEFFEVYKSVLPGLLSNRNSASSPTERAAQTKKTLLVPA
eukprot:144656-Rhodomonas_salina.5